jgi:predicted esterase
MSERTPMVRCRLGFATCAIFALALLSASRADAKQPSASGIKGQSTGSFQFVDPGSNHPITVWFCRPPTLTSDTRIVFVMHGSESQTARQACSLATPHLETLNAIVLAPQFAEEYYPGDAYMFGNMTDAAGKMLPKTAWALTAVERLFDVVRDEMKLNRTEYDIVGFSGGAQFVHRLTLFVPEARFRRAVAASGARYAMPSWLDKFPYGLADSPTDRAALGRAFSRDLVVLLGDRDVADITNRDTTDQTTGDPADSRTQGTTRFARGLRFFAMATDEAVALSVPLRWELRIVPGVAHSPAPMVQAALELLRK